MNIAGGHGLHSPGVIEVARRFDSAAPHAVKSGGEGYGVLRKAGSSSPKPIQTPQMFGADFSASTRFEHEAAQSASATARTAGRTPHSAYLMSQEIGRAHV